MMRGEVWWVSFDPSVGGETRKTRPAVIVSNNLANRSMNRVQVVPFTSNTSNPHAGEVIVQLNNQLSKAMINQLMTASKLRFGSFIGRLSDADMKRIEQEIKLQLGL